MNRLALFQPVGESWIRPVRWRQWALGCLLSSSTVIALWKP
jgi:hypothetical protein